MTVELVLGSAQFAQARLSEGEIFAILDRAEEIGIQTIDTAKDYGNSEKIIGQWISKVPNRISTYKLMIKIDSHQIIQSQNPIEFIEAQVASSLRRLGRKTLDAVIIHDSGSLKALPLEELVQKLIALKQAQQVEKIGFSLQHQRDSDHVLSLVNPDILQISLSIFDQRWLTSSMIHSLNTAGIEVQARSILMQGKLLAIPDNLPEEYLPFANHVKKYANSINQFGYTFAEVALGFIKSAPGVHKAIIGVESVEELDNLYQAWLRAPIDFPFGAFFVAEEALS